MDRRTFLSLSLALPGLGQTAKPGPPGTQSKPAAPAGQAPKPVVQAAPAGVPWTQWGGPHRNFQTEATGLKDTWPAGGPPVIWKRPLGEGLLVAGGRERRALHDVREAAARRSSSRQAPKRARRSGNSPTPMTFTSDAAQDMGNGPYSTPLVVGDRLFTTGVAGRLQCLDKKTGKLLWAQQLWAQHGGSRLMYGYASSPIAFRETVIVPVGGPGKALDGVPAGGRQARVGEERFRQRLLVADPDQRQRARAAGGR